MDELWDEIRSKPRNQWKMRNEALQVCAMALRFLHDVTPLLGPDVWIHGSASAENKEAN